MKVFNETICVHYVNALEYGVFSALDENEIKKLTDFMNLYPDACYEYGKESYLGYDTISGLKTDCIDVTINIFK